MPASSNNVKFNLTVAGVSYRTAPIEVREKFSINKVQFETIYKEGLKKLPNLLILSTCNRTELYTSYPDSSHLKYLLTKYSRATNEVFENYTFKKTGQEAIEHFFRVSSGLDSQILGDLEIIGQVRRSSETARRHKAVDPFFNRLFQIAFQTAKRIRSETSICEGSASTSFAAIQYMKSQLEDLQNKKVLLFGAGKIGRITCENLVGHIQEDQLTIINRNNEKAGQLADRYNVSVKPIQSLKKEILASDVVIVATNAGEYTIDTDLLDGATGHKIFIDLSVPRNVNPAIRSTLFKVAYIDDLTEIQKEAISNREASLPEAEALIREGLDEFNEWLRTRHLAPAFKEIKKSLQQIQKQEIAPYLNNLDDNEKARVEDITNKIVNRLARNFINHLKENHNSDTNPVKTMEAVFGIKVNN